MKHSGKNELKLKFLNKNYINMKKSKHKLIYKNSGNK